MAVRMVCAGAGSEGAWSEEAVEGEEGELLSD